MSLIPARLSFGLGALAALLMMLLAILYFQQQLQLEPCPLCIFQRVAVIAIGITCLMATIQNPRVIGTRIYALAIGLFAIAGGSVSARHSWLQHLPPEQVPECGPGLSYMLDSFPIFQALEMVFRGSGECAEVTWQFVGLSIPEWTLVGFVGFFLYACLIGLNAKVLQRS